MDLLPDCFLATPRIYCSLFVTPSLFVPRGACGGGFGPAGGHVTLVSEWAGLSDTPGYMRPAEDRERSHIVSSVAGKSCQLCALQRDRLGLV